MTPLDTPAVTPARPAGWYLPGLCAAVVVVYLASVYGRMAPPKQPYNLDALAQVPVLEGGRVKPLDSAARLYLKLISGQSVAQDAAGVEHPAIEWYIDTLGSDIDDKTSRAWDYRVVRIDNEQVLAQLKFSPREGLRYSFNELRPQLELIEAKGMTAADKGETGKKLTLDERKWIEVLERLSLMRHVAEGRGKDTKKNKFHLLPPPEAGKSWESLGEAKAKADDAVFPAVMEAARAGVKSQPGGYGPDRQAALADRLLGRVGVRATDEQREGLLSLLFESDPAEMKGRKRDVIFQEVVRELPIDQQAVIVGQRRSAVERALKADPAADSWDRMIVARRDKRPDDFNAALAEYRDTRLDAVTPDELAKVRLETTYNRFAPFMQCIALYVIVFVLSAVGFVMNATEKKAWGEALRRSASWVLYATLLVHTGALLVRMSLMDRPLVFVTNLYSSAVFIGWGCVVLGMVLERIFPLGIGNAVAGVLGMATTIVAHNLTTDDTLEMMEAVLDTNFWLATHVTTVTLGYTATFVAGFLSAVYVLLQCATVVKDGFTQPQPPSFAGLLSFGSAAAGIVGVPMILLWFFCTAAAAKFEWVHSSIPMVVLVVTGGAAAFYAGGLLFLKAGDTATDAAGKPLSTGQLPQAAKPLAGMALTAETTKVLGQMIYGVLCFATLLSFVGTVLGGIWADQSWGRFWGWDPKENGAVLIVLWNAMILHARWCGMVKTRGIAVLALFGNVICAWSWFGTNQLGIGLHAYGFDTRLADGCTNFWLSQLVIMGLGVIPAQYWASASRRRGDGPASVGPTATPAAPTAGPSVVKKKGRKR